MSSGEVSVNLMCLYKSWCKLIQFSSPPRKDSDMTFNNHWNHQLQPGRVPNNHNSCTTWVPNGSWFTWTADSHVIVCRNWVCDGIFTIHKASFARRASSMHKGRSTNIKRTLLRLQTRKTWWTSMKYSSVKNIKTFNTFINIFMCILAHSLHNKLWLHQITKTKKHAHEHVHCCWPGCVGRQTDPSSWSMQLMKCTSTALIT